MKLRDEAPNLITVGRLALAAACFTCLELAGPTGSPATGLVAAAAVAFSLAAATDWLDGWLARRLDRVTRFGRIADPLVDKVLVLGALIAMLRFDSVRSVLPAWVVIVLVLRELTVTSLRAMAEGEGHAFPADRFGKWKMVVQTGLCLGLFASMLARERVPVWALHTLVWSALGLTIASGYGYVARARGLLAAEDRPDG